MKPLSLFAALAATGLAFAQDMQSRPFNLVLQSANKTLDGQSLSTCHTGAAIESICILRGTKAIFHLNTTEGVQPGLGGVAGVLTWDLPTQPPTSSSMTLYTDPATNVALPLIFPGSNNVQYVGFDDSDQLNIVSHVDDTKTPPSTQTPRVLKNWYVCITYWSGYTYQTLAWTLGVNKPQNPSCVKVNVLRVYI